MQTLPLGQVDFSSLVTDLRAGQTLVYPTETCYGLGGVATDARVTEQIFAIKQRPEDKPFLLLFADVEMVKEYVEWNLTLERLAATYWPGPLTILMTPKDLSLFPPGIVGNTGKIAGRVSSSSFAHDLVSALQTPLISTSANIAGLPSPYSVEAVSSMFQNQVSRPDIIVDAGVLPQNLPSTIVEVVGETIRVIRQGDLVVE